MNINLHQSIVLIICLILVSLSADIFAQDRNWTIPSMTANPDSPNILWIVTDQQRWDTIGELGNNYVNTPNIDRLVREGVTFTHAYVQSPVCTPSRASFLTGMYPSSVRATRNGAAYWSEAAPLVTAILSDAGFDGGSVGKLHLSTAQANKPELRPENDGYRVFHFMHSPYQGGSSNEYQKWYKDRGVDINELRSEYGYVPVEYHPTTWATDRTIDFITEHREEPWFISYNIYDPHGPFDPPASYVDRYDINTLPGPRFKESDLVEKGVFSNVMFQGSTPRKFPDHVNKRRMASYWAQIDLIDENIGRVLEALEISGQIDNTLIIFTSDHGEMLGDHGLTAKGARFYEGLVRVPLIFWYPSKLEQNLRSDALVELTDIAPTLLQMTGLAIPEKMQGISLLPILTGERSPDFHRSYVRSEFYDTLQNRIEEGQPEPSFATMIRDERFKLVVYHGHEKGELFDLINDPNEFDNLWDNKDYQDVRFELMVKSYELTVRAIDIGPERIGRY
jgi:arylsulfatase